MPAPGKRPELIRLQKAFEAEAGAFPDLWLSILYFSQQEIPTDRTFRKPNHQVMLWQYYLAIHCWRANRPRIHSHGQRAGSLFRGLKRKLSMTSHRTFPLDEWQADICSNDNHFGDSMPADRLHGRHPA
jgi:hypothetical protein